MKNSFLLNKFSVGISGFQRFSSVFEVFDLVLVLVLFGCI